MIKVENNTIFIVTPKTQYEHKEEFSEIIDSLVKKGTDRIELDFSETSYIASDFLGLIMWKKEELTKKNIALVITKVSDPLKAVFQNLRLMKYFNLE